MPVLIDTSLDAVAVNELSRGCRRTFMEIPHFDELEHQNGITLETLSMPDNDRLFTCHTSGTTGMPKKITYRQGNILWALEEYAEIYKLNVNNVVLFALPFHYCYSIIPCCIVPFIYGKTVVVASERSTAADVARVISAKKVNIIAVVPTFYQQLLSLDLSQLDFTSLTLCDSGGESIPLPIIAKFQEKTAALITEGYGLTETTSLTHFLLPDAEGGLRLGSVGRACRGVECRIVDEGYRPVAQGEIGELLVRGSMVIDGYDDSSKDLDAFHDGWFKTGDLFYADADDFYYLVSRKKDAINIPPRLVGVASKYVPLLLDNVDVLDVAYKCLSPEDVQVFVVAAADADRTRIKDDILAALPSELAELVTVRFVDRLPRTATGKVLKGIL